MKWLLLFSGAVGLIALFLLLWRLADTCAARNAWNRLIYQSGPAGSVFDPSAIDALPDAAQRYLRYAITPGTPLVSVVEIAMNGQLGLGTKDKPAYRPMTADQILAPPAGLVWKVRTGPVSGSDAAMPETSWTRFWLFNLIPVIRVSGNRDHHRSAFGRVVCEGAFWVPASLLPGRNVVWEDVNADTARAIVTYGDYSQSIELKVEANGQPSRILIQRWSNENADKAFREQPFGGYLSNFREIGGYCLPMHVEGGNLIGTQDYFPFFIANVQQIRYPQLAEHRRKNKT